MNLPQKHMLNLTTRAALAIFALVVLSACSLVPGTPATGTPAEPAPAPSSTQPPATPTPTQAPAVYIPAEEDLLDRMYIIDGQAVTLAGGVSEVEAAPGSAAKITTRYFGSPAFGDLNGDGLDDATLILTQTSGGSGTFHFAAAAINTGSGLAGTNAVLLGDRIAPQSTAIEDGLAVVNYAGRNPGEDYSVQPSLALTKCLALKDGTLVETILPSQFTGRPWRWVQTLLSDGTRIEPRKPEAFTITFSEDGRVSGTTDCNGFAGAYTLQENQISFGPLASTKMYCEGSQETDFTSRLAEVQSLLFQDGRLVFELKLDSGQIILE